MSVENKKRLSDDLNELIDVVKETAKKATDKAAEFAGEAKEKAKDVFEDAKQTTSDFVDDSNRALNDGKNVAIIAHITLIGWIIALIKNNDNKTELGSFYLRQMLGLMILSFVSSLIPIVNLFAWIVLLVAWIMSLISAINGEKKPTFLLGEQFQEWFKSL